MKLRVFSGSARMVGPGIVVSMLLVCDCSNAASAVTVMASLPATASGRSSPTVCPVAIVMPLRTYGANDVPSTAMLYSPETSCVKS